MTFLVECKPDWVMIEALTSSLRRNIVHAGNKSGVIKHLISHYEDSKGIVDEDPGRSTPRYLQRFREVEEFEEYALKILYYAKRNNYLFILSPRLEDWILNVARQSNIDVTEYGLPDDPIMLHAEINLKIDRFEILIRDLMRTSRQVKFLAEILVSYSCT